MDSEPEKGLKRIVPLGHHGLRDCGADSIFSCLGITLVARVVCIGELSTGRVGLGGFQTQF